MTETTQMQSTNLQHSISSTTYACVLTSCKYQSIIQYWNRGKIKISVRHPHTMCNRTKNHKVYFMDRTKHNMNFSVTKIRNNANAINKIITLNLKVNIFMCTHSLQIPIHHTVLKKRKNKISVRHPHTMCNRTKSKIKMRTYTT